jgi:hypothetical protein
MLLQHQTAFGSRNSEPSMVVLMLRFKKPPQHSVFSRMGRGQYVQCGKLLPLCDVRKTRQITQKGNLTIDAFCIPSSLGALRQRFGEPHANPELFRMIIECARRLGVVWFLSQAATSVIEALHSGHRVGRRRGQPVH